jgi:hypothetical protein
MVSGMCDDGGTLVSVEPSQTTIRKLGRRKRSKARRVVACSQEQPSHLLLMTKSTAFDAAANRCCGVQPVGMHDI